LFVLTIEIISGMESSPDRIKVLLAFAAIYIIWGSTYFGVHLALKSFPPFLLTAFRLLIGGIALLIFCIVRKEPMPALTDIRRNALWGQAIFIGGVLTVVWAQQYISSSLASTIITTPFWFIVFDKRQWKFYFSSKWIIAGLITGLIGVILLMSYKKGKAGNGSEIMQLAAILTMVVGSCFWVIGSLFLRYHPSATSIYVSTTIQLLSAGIVCVLLSYFTGEFSQFNKDVIRTDAVIALFYLSIVSSLITFLAYVWLIKVQPPAIVSTYSYINPLVATLLGWAFAGEHVLPIQLLALLIILSGVFLVNVPRYQFLKRN
jgi:drug/metabolite transporter (DMT)-like permease